MKKITVYILATFLFVSSVNAGDNWFMLTPSMNNDGKMINAQEYNDVKKVNPKFKVVELIEELLS